MPVYYAKATADDLNKFFSSLPVDRQPKIISDKDFPSVWDKETSDKLTIIATDEPRADTAIKEVVIEGQQAEDVVDQLDPTGADENSQSEPIPEPTDEPDKVEGYQTYKDRGFKVGAIL